MERWNVGMVEWIFFLAHFVCMFGQRGCLIWAMVPGSPEEESTKKHLIPAVE